MIYFDEVKEVGGGRVRVAEVLVASNRYIHGVFVFGDAFGGTHLIGNTLAESQLYSSPSSSYYYYYYYYYYYIGCGGVWHALYGDVCSQLLHGRGWAW